jgi:C-terminal processing protease CtpA/Prc
MNILPLVMVFTLHGSASYTNSIGYIGIRDNTMSREIVRVYPGSPAEKAGICRKDKILAVVDEEGGKDISGPVGSFVTLSIKRGDDIKLFVIQRVPEQWGRHR